MSTNQYVAGEKKELVKKKYNKRNGELCYMPNDAGIIFFPC